MAYARRSGSIALWTLGNGSGRARLDKNNSGLPAAHSAAGCTCDRPHAALVGWTSSPAGGSSATEQGIPWPVGSNAAYCARMSAARSNSSARRLSFASLGLVMVAAISAPRRAADALALRRMSSHDCPRRRLRAMCPRTRANRFGVKGHGASPSACATLQTLRPWPPDSARRVALPGLRRYRRTRRTELPSPQRPSAR